MSDASLQPDVLEERLVAYLDGELSAEESRQIDELLANDPNVRETLARLDRTWRMLESLDTSSVDDRFTRSTLEMAVAAAADEVAEARSRRPRRQRRLLLAIVGALTAAAGIGFVTAALSRPDPDHDLLEHLPVVEQLDQYAQAGDIEFLRLLADHGVFHDENLD